MKRAYGKYIAGHPLTMPAGSSSLPEALGAALILAGALLSEWTGARRN